VIERKSKARRRKKASQETGWRESNGGRRGSRWGGRGRSDRPRTWGASVRRRGRGREEGGTAKTESREAGAVGRDCVMRWVLE